MTMRLWAMIAVVGILYILNLVTAWFPPKEDWQGAVTIALRLFVLWVPLQVGPEFLEAFGYAAGHLVAASGALVIWACVFIRRYRVAGGK